MSVENNANRTIDGVNEIQTDRINVVEAIELNGDDGSANQFIKVSNDGITQGWSGIVVDDLPNIPKNKIETLATLTLTTNGGNSNVYDPLATNDTYNVVVPITNITTTAPVSQTSNGLTRNIQLSLDNSTIHSNGDGKLAVKEVPYDKLDLTNEITNTDIDDSAAIAYSKLNLSGEIKNADIKGTAAIAITKLAASTISGVSLGGNLANLTAGTHISFSSGTTYNGGTALTITASNDNTIYTAKAEGNIVIDGSNRIAYTSNANLVAKFGLTTFNGSSAFASSILGITELNGTMKFRGTNDIGTSGNSDGATTNPTNIYTANIAATTGTITTLNSTTGTMNLLTSPNIISASAVGSNVAHFATNFSIETEWLSDVSAAANSNYVNSCWFFGNVGEGGLDSNAFSMVVAGSGSGSKPHAQGGGFAGNGSHAYSQNGTGGGAAPVLYSKVFPKTLSIITRLSFYYILGNNSNGGQTPTSNAAAYFYLCWDDGNNNFTLPNGGLSNGTYFTLIRNSVSPASGWVSVDLDISSLTSAQKTSFGASRRVAFYLLNDSGSFGLTDIILKVSDRLSNSGEGNLFNLGIINDAPITANQRGAKVSEGFGSLYGGFAYLGLNYANGWFYQPIDISRFVADDDANSPSSMSIFEFAYPSSYNSAVADYNGLVINSGHTQVYYMFDCPTGFKIDGYYVGLINRSNGAYLGLNGASTLYNKLIQYTGGGAGAAFNSVASQQTNSSGVPTNNQNNSFGAFNKENGIRLRWSNNRNEFWDDGFPDLTTGASPSAALAGYGGRASLGVSNKYAIMCFKNGNFSNAEVFRSGYIKYLRV